MQQISELRCWLTDHSLVLLSETAFGWLCGGSRTCGGGGFLYSLTQLWITPAQHCYTGLLGEEARYFRLTFLTELSMLSYHRSVLHVMRTLLYYFTSLSDAVLGFSLSYFGGNVLPLSTPLCRRIPPICTPNRQPWSQHPRKNGKGPTIHRFDNVKAWTRMNGV